MTTPINGFPFPDDDSPNAPWLHFEALAEAIDAVAVPNFTTATERNNAYAAYVTAGGTMKAGKLCSVNGLIYRSTGTSTSAWDLLVPATPRIIQRNTIPDNLISSGGGNQTGVTSGIPALANFTLASPGVVQVSATFRGGGAGAMECKVLIDGAQVGEVGVTRSDVTCAVVGAVSLAAGSHAVAMRADAIGGNVTWYSARLTMVVGVGE